MVRHFECWNMTLQVNIRMDLQLTEEKHLSLLVRDEEKCFIKWTLHFCIPIIYFLLHIRVTSFVFIKRAQQNKA